MATNLVVLLFSVILCPAVAEVLTQSSVIRLTEMKKLIQDQINATEEQKQLIENQKLLIENQKEVIQRLEKIIQSCKAGKPFFLGGGKKFLFEIFSKDL